MTKRRDFAWLLSLVALIAVGSYWMRPTPPAEETPSPTPAASTPAAPARLPVPADWSEPIYYKPSSTLRALAGVKAPPLTKAMRVRFETGAGNFVVEVYPNAAPAHTRRFLELVDCGYFQDTPVFRVVPGFVAQFGLNSRFAEFPAVADEPSLFCLERGTIAFAKSGMPDSATTQLFINYADNTESLIPEKGGKGVGIFTAFGKIISGQVVVEKCRPVGGDPLLGLDQAKLQNDTPGYLKTLTEQPTMIIRAYRLSR